MKIHVPPIKTQGIKTKLVQWIKSIIPEDFNGVWIEPFMGSGVVAFNIIPKKAILADTNPHLINFYSSILKKEITPQIARLYLEKEGKKLFENGEEHYYLIRERFNKEKDPLDFLFLNRSCFNGMIRFNRKGGFNVPFCRKPERFAKAYITKIVNQIEYVYKLLQLKDVRFVCQDFSETIQNGESGDIIYCDPPYIGRHTEYFNGWDEKKEFELNEQLSNTSSNFILSTWHSNVFRENDYIKTIWKNYNLITREHFYHLGGKEKNRNSMLEALITNYDVNPVEEEPIKKTQLTLFEHYYAT